MQNSEGGTLSEACTLQVGHVEKDHCECLRAEKDTRTPRPVLIVDAAHPGADALAIAGAAFAAASMALASVADRGELAALCMQHARELYEAAGAMRQDYCVSLPECAKTYKAEVWQQFMFYCAAWLYKATGEEVFKAVRSSSTRLVTSFIPRVAKGATLLVVRMAQHAPCVATRLTQDCVAGRSAVATRSRGQGALAGLQLAGRLLWGVRAAVDGAARPGARQEACLLCL